MWIPGGMHFENLKKGDIILSASQMKSLFGTGRASGVGHAYAEGTGQNHVRELVSAYGGGFLPTPGNNYKYTGVTSYNSSTTTKSKSLNKTAEKATKAAEDAIDFIAILLDRVARQTKKAIDKIDQAIGLANKQSTTASAIQKIQTEITKNQQAYNKYIAQANAVGLSSDYKTKVQNGSLDIKNITDEKLKEKISDYQKWYELALGVEDKLIDLNNQEQELAKRRLENVETYYDAIVKVNTAMQDVVDSKSKLNEALGIAIDTESNISDLKDAIKAQEDTYNQLVTKLNDYQAEFSQLVANGYIKEGSDAWYEGQEKIQNFTSEIYKASTALIEYQDKLNEIDYKRLQYVIDGFERAVSKIDKYVSLLEARDEDVPESLYTEQIDNNDARINEIAKLREKKLAEQSVYDVASERYQELAKEINDLDEEALGLLAENESLMNSIFELRMKPLDDAIKKYDELDSEISDLLDLLNEESYFDKNGIISDDGLAALALMQQQMEVNKQKIADYRKGLEKLQEAYDNGTISEKEFNDQSVEYRKGIRDSVKANEALKDSVTDLYMKQMQLENEALKEIIQKRKDALAAKADYYNYDKTIKGQSKDVAMLQSQISALEGVNNAEAKAELKRLKQQLSDAEDALSESKRQHALDMQNKGYDQMVDDLDNILEDTEYEVVHNAEKQQSVISSMLHNVVNMYENAYNKINNIIADTGLVGSSDFNENQSQLGTQSGANDLYNGATQLQPNVNPSDGVNNIVTSPINNNKDFNHNLEQSIMQKPNNDNRLIAELVASPTSVTLEEGRTTTVVASVRPNDAKNKTLSWTSSDNSIATVSNGSISAHGSGNCQIIVATTDGSGFSVSIAVTVTKKPEPVKPTTPSNPSTKPSTGGDGIPTLGEKVTFDNGSYYYDSQGVSPSGKKYQGKAVYITNINTRSWATRPYHISTGSKLGNGDLGWVSLSQLKGYASGSSFIGKDQFAWTQEKGSELLYKRADGAILTPLGTGDKVWSNQQTDNLYNLSKFDPDLLINKNFSLPSVEREVLNSHVELHYQNMLNLENSTITQEALKDVETLLKQSIPMISKEVSNYIYKDAKKGGWR